MTCIYRILMAAILVSFGATVSAQCIPPNAPGPPRLWDGERGCYVPQGTPSLQTLQQRGQVVYVQQPQQFVGNQQVVGVGGGQQVLVSGQQQAVACTWGGRGENILGGGIIGGLLGVLARDSSDGARKGAAIGALLGTLIPCNSQQVASGQQVVVQQPQGVVTQQQGIQQGIQCPAGTQPGILNLPGHPKHGQTVCAPPGDTNILGNQQQVQQQQPQQVATMNPCAGDPGTKRGILDLPGHPKHGQTVCAKDGDPNISSWL